MSRAAVSRAVLVLAVAIGLAACQPVEDPNAVATEPVAPAVTDPLGRPDEEFPRTLDELLARGEIEALTWQDEPHLADATVWLDASGQWQRTRLNYVAAHAQRLLTVSLDPEEVRMERPALAGLQLFAIDDAGIEQLPPFTEDALEPVALGEAARPALAQCEVSGPVEAVLYATGAPGSWDGTEWTLTPTWRATVLTAEGGAVVQPSSGTPFAPLVCVDPLSS